MAEAKNTKNEVILIVMGVAGSGKSTVGRRVAARLSCGFSDADDFHPAENKAKMASGVPLSDEDRQPWLYSLRSSISDWLRRGQSHVLACSALKESYRELLQCDDPRVLLVYLKASPELVEARLRARKGHYMKARMVESQFDALEEPAPGTALVLHADAPLDEVIEQVCSAVKAETA